MTTNTNKFFDTKEQYLAFRTAFASAVNSPRAKKGKPNEYGYKESGWLHAGHFMLLNLVRGLPQRRGFTEITNNIKLTNGMPADFNIRNAESSLNSAIGNAKAFTENKPAELASWEIPKKVLNIGLEQAKAELIEQKTVKRQVALKAKLDSFLEPFAGTLTIADLARLGDLR